MHVAQVETVKAQTGVEKTQAEMVSADGTVCGWKEKPLEVNIRVHLPPHRDHLRHRHPTHRHSLDQ